MEDKKKVVFIGLCVIMLIVLVSISAYAYISNNEFSDGKINLEYKSKGVDVLKFDKQDLTLNVDDSNFSINNGNDLVGEVDFIGTLETSNDKTEYCYETYIILPNNPVFSYSKAGTPELILNVSLSDDGTNYTKLISEKDITTQTGLITVPTSLNGNEYKFKISTTKGNSTKVYWKANVRLVWFNDADQSKNANKNYNLTLKANIIEC